MTKRQLVVLAFTGFVLSVLIAPQATAAVKVSDPTRIEIPAIRVDAKIQARGTTAAGYMVPPDSAWNVAWHMHGVRPGEIGNAVMYGHLNTRASNVAVFSQLHRLRVGNSVRVTDRKGTVRTFTVTKIGVYKRDQLPLRDISGKTADVHLNLYTCAGYWNRRVGDYSHRFVVYTSLTSVSLASAQ